MPLKPSRSRVTISDSWAEGAGTLAMPRFEAQEDGIFLGGAILPQPAMQRPLFGSILPVVGADSDLSDRASIRVARMNYGDGPDDLLDEVRCISQIEQLDVTERFSTSSEIAPSK